jgi:hypothetical protein
VSGLKLAKVLGSGREGGFGLAPSATRQGLFCVFDGQDRAVDFLEHSAVVASYRRHAREFCSVLLRPTSSRGAWDGLSLTVAAGGPPAHSDAARPVAALTRASIKATRAWDFWRMTPAAQRSLECAEGCRLSVGLGEAPLLRQATFSIWDSTAAMAAYARQGAHQAAIQASLNGQHFSESMFVRFEVIQIRGQWKGLHRG